MTVRPRIKATSDRMEVRIKNRLNWFVVMEMKGRRTRRRGERIEREREREL